MGTQPCPFLIILLPISKKNPNYTISYRVDIYRADCTETFAHMRAYTCMHTCMHTCWRNKEKAQGDLSVAQQCRCQGKQGRSLATSLRAFWLFIFSIHTRTPKPVWSHSPECYLHAIKVRVCLCARVCSTFISFCFANCEVKQSPLPV